MPVLEVTENGSTTKIAQSLAIARYLARKFGLAGKSDLESALADMYVDQVGDVVQELIKIRFLEQDEAKKKVLAENFQKEVLPKNLALFEARLKANATGFVAGNALTWADLSLFNFLDSVGHFAPGHSLDAHPELKKFHDKIGSTDKVKQWLASRPKTEF